jgi:hypothetical protein
MLDFPNSAPDIKKLAEKLVRHLHGKIENTKDRKEWSGRNFCLLTDFFHSEGLACFPGVDGPQFLWDFVGYVKGHGILIAAESEWSREPGDVEYDFEKLLYVRSPLKLVLCRLRATSDAGADEEAKSICKLLRDFMNSTCKNYSSGELFILYCVWWALDGGPNRDIAYTLQVHGDPIYRPLDEEQFQLVSN